MVAPDLKRALVAGKEACALLKKVILHVSHISHFSTTKLSYGSAPYLIHTLAAEIVK